MTVKADGPLFGLQGHFQAGLARAGIMSGHHLPALLIAPPRTEQ